MSMFDEEKNVPDEDRGYIRIPVASKQEPRLELDN
jgi:hypothetical protein